MESENIIEILNERIKELTCLYEISNIVTRHSDCYTDTMNAVVRAIPKAWKYPQHAVAEIQLLDGSFCSGTSPEVVVSQETEIEVDGQSRGTLSIHYPAAEFSVKDFLVEEAQLLQKLANEISNIIERFEHRKKEEILERKVRHNDRLAILGQIAAGIAHEINTPLTSILGFSELIQENEENIKGDTEKIINAALHAREVVKKLMFFACEMPRQMQQVTITPLLEDAIKLLNPSLQKAGITLEFIPAPEDKEVMIELDPVQITQVIFNLIINAIQATPPKGHIEISTHVDGKYLVVSFKDNGSGIPSGIKDRIFEPFFSTKIVGEGSGLGLSVVHGIVKSHHGKIDFESEEGEGTTFFVSLPIVSR
ncbi:ATP-binding protein [Fulvivirga ulvae]|uniref:sensor histidine kinase n=1 Tax=Fulvivirga ulvae TaxID=2904245 RepID=UPI001F301BD4|nr:ATP-binding protein [Fulvivirga ulvae]UII35015.1 ATP-binding protein [Fulvivirga ulvae]